MSDDLKGDDFEDMEAWRQWSSNKPHLSQLHSDLLRWWSKGQRMRAELDKLKAELEEAREIIHFTAQHGAFPSGIKHRARAFLDKAGE